MAEQFGVRGRPRRNRGASGSALYLACSISFLTVCLVSCAHQKAKQAPPEATDPPAPLEAPAPPQVSKGQPARLRTSVTWSFEFSEIAQNLPKHVGAEDASKWLIPVPKNLDGVWVALDQHPAREVLKRELRLVDLLNEDEEISPGFHFLTIFQFKPWDALSAPSDDQVVVIQVHAVSFDTEPTGMPRAPGCSLFTGRLTFNGAKPADSVTLFALPLSPDIAEVDYRVVGEASDGSPFSGTMKAEVGTLVRLIDPPSGDFTLSAACFTKARELGQATRIITINRDAEELGP